MYDLYRYYAISKNLKFEKIHENNGHIVVLISGLHAWKMFKFEVGKHVVQRVPPNERNGRRHTSIISVGILPIKNDLWEPLREQDLEIIAQTGKQGAGGQNVNKVHSAIRIKHIPTGLSVFINGRDQGQNKKEALKIITARVNDMRQAKEDKAYAEFRRLQLGDGKRGSKIRTYNFLESRVTDHQLGVKTTKIWEVMKGNLDLLVNNYILKTAPVSST